MTLDTDKLLELHKPTLDFIIEERDGDPDMVIGCVTGALSWKHSQEHIELVKVFKKYVAEKMK